jgi:hypothetical protein
MIDHIKANNYIESKLGKPFAWGTNDCNTFIVGYFDAVLGTDLLKIIYKKYTTKLGATFGDILIKKNENWDSCHICIGSKIASIDENIGTAIMRINNFKDFDFAYKFEK